MSLQTRFDASLSLQRTRRSIYQDYCQLTKPGLVFFVVLSAYVSYIFASYGQPHTVLLLPLLLGVYLSASGAHALNQWIEADTDGRMTRTRNRPLAAGRCPKWLGVTLGLLLAVGGVLVHGYYINLLTALITLLTLCLYLLFYTPLKKLSVWNTWVGAVAGALPALVGWSAVWNHLPWEAFLLPLMIYCWQIPHFLSLAYKYQQEYANAGLKMLPHGDAAAKILRVMMVLHVVLLTEVTLLPYLLGVTSQWLFALMIFLNLWFFWRTMVFCFRPNNKNASKLFMDSNYYLVLFYTFVILERQLTYLF